MKITPTMVFILLSLIVAGLAFSGKEIPAGLTFSLGAAAGNMIANPR